MFSPETNVGLHIGNVENLFLGMPSTAIGVHQSERLCQVHPGRPLEFFCADCCLTICLGCKLCEHDEHKVQSLVLAAAEAARHVEDAGQGRLASYQQFLEARVGEAEEGRQAVSRKAQEVKDHVDKRHKELLTFFDEENQATREKLAEKYFSSEQCGAAGTHDPSVDQRPATGHVLSPCVDVGLRRAHLSAMIEDSVVTVLQRVDSVTEQVNSQLTTTADALQHEMARLHSLRQRCQKTVGNQSQVDVLRLYREILTDWSEDKLLSSQASLTSPGTVLLALDFLAGSPQDDDDVLLKLLLCDQKAEVQAAIVLFLGVAGEEISSYPPRVLVQAQFRYSKSSDAYAFNICPGPATVGVSYNPWSSDKYEGKTHFFLYDGRPVVTSFEPGLYTLATSSALQAAGYSWHHRTILSVMNRGNNTVFQTAMYAKTRKDVLHMVVENPSKHGEAKVIGEVRLFGKWAWLRHHATLAGINYPVSFDCSEDGRHMAVIVKTTKEQKADNKPHVGLQVRVYHTEGRSRKTPCAKFSVYRPSKDPFLPTDVCFFTVGRREVLVVSDLHDDSLQMVEPSTCRLLGPLVVRHLALNQPTALNKDVQGRLWVACRGGQVGTVSIVRN